MFTETLQDSYQLALELEKAWKEGSKAGTPMDVVSSLKR
jgi:zeaxanthin epoxidase